MAIITLTHLPSEQYKLQLSKNNALVYKNEVNNKSTLYVHITPGKPPKEIIVDSYKSDGQHILFTQGDQQSILKISDFRDPIPVSDIPQSTREALLKAFDSDSADVSKQYEEAVTQHDLSKFFGPESTGKIVIENNNGKQYVIHDDPKRTGPDRILINLDDISKETRDKLIGAFKAPSSNLYNIYQQAVEEYAPIKKAKAAVNEIYETEKFRDKLITLMQYLETDSDGNLRFKGMSKSLSKEETNTFKSYMQCLTDITKLPPGLSVPLSVDILALQRDDVTKSEIPKYDSTVMYDPTATLAEQVTTLERHMGSSNFDNQFVRLQTAITQEENFNKFLTEIEQTKIGEEETTLGAFRQDKFGAVQRASKYPLMLAEVGRPLKAGELYGRVKKLEATVKEKCLSTDQGQSILVKSKSSTNANTKLKEESIGGLHKLQETLFMDKSNSEAEFQQHRQTYAQQIRDLLITCLKPGQSLPDDKQKILIKLQTAESIQAFEAILSKDITKNTKFTNVMTDNFPSRCKALLSDIRSKKMVNAVDSPLGLISKLITAIQKPNITIQETYNLITAAAENPSLHSVKADLTNLLAKNIPELCSVFVANEEILQNETALAEIPAGSYLITRTPGYNVHIWPKDLSQTQVAERFKNVTQPSIVIYGHNNMIVFPAGEKPETGYPKYKITEKQRTELELEKFKRDSNGTIEQPNDPAFIKAMDKIVKSNHKSTYGKALGIEQCFQYHCYYKNGEGRLQQRAIEEIPGLSEAIKQLPLEESCTQISGNDSRINSLMAPLAKFRNKKFSDYRNYVEQYQQLQTDITITAKSLIPHLVKHNFSLSVVLDKEKSSTPNEKIWIKNASTQRDDLSKIVTRLNNFLNQKPKSAEDFAKIIKSCNEALNINTKKWGLFSITPDTKKWMQEYTQKATQHRQKYTELDRFRNSINLKEFSEEAGYTTETDPQRPDRPLVILKSMSNLQNGEANIKYEPYVGQYLCDAQTNTLLYVASPDNIQVITAGNKALEPIMQRAEQSGNFSISAQEITRLTAGAENNIAIDPRTPIIERRLSITKDCRIVKLDEVPKQSEQQTLFNEHVGKYIYIAPHKKLVYIKNADDYTIIRLNNYTPLEKHLESAEVASAASEDLMDDESSRKLDHIELSVREAQALIWNHKDTELHSFELVKLDKLPAKDELYSYVGKYFCLSTEKGISLYYVEKSNQIRKIDLNNSYPLQDYISSGKDNTFRLSPEKNFDLIVKYAKNEETMVIDKTLVQLDRLPASKDLASHVGKYIYIGEKNLYYVESSNKIQKINLTSFTPLQDHLQKSTTDVFLLTEKQHGELIKNKIQKIQILSSVPRPLGQRPAVEPIVDPASTQATTTIKTTSSTPEKPTPASSIVATAQHIKNIGSSQGMAKDLSEFYNSHGTDGSPSQKATQPNQDQPSKSSGTSDARMLDKLGAKPKRPESSQISFGQTSTATLQPSTSTAATPTIPSGNPPISFSFSAVHLTTNKGSFPVTKLNVEAQQAEKLLEQQEKPQLATASL